MGPRGSFTEFIEWVLVNCGSAYTIGPAEDDIVTNPSLNTPPETSHPPPTATGMMELPVVTADRPTAMDESEPEKRSEGVIAPGPVPFLESDQVREPATSCIAEGGLGGKPHPLPHRCG